MKNLFLALLLLPLFVCGSRAASSFSVTVTIPSAGITNAPAQIIGLGTKVSAYPNTANPNPASLILLADQAGSTNENISIQQLMNLIPVFYPNMGTNTIDTGSTNNSGVVILTNNLLRSFAVQNTIARTDAQNTFAPPQKFIGTIFVYSNLTVTNNLVVKATGNDPGSRIWIESPGPVARQEIDFLMPGDFVGSPTYQTNLIGIGRDVATGNGAFFAMMFDARLRNGLGNDMMEYGLRPANNAGKFHFGAGGFDAPGTGEMTNYFISVSDPALIGIYAPYTFGVITYSNGYMCKVLPSYADAYTIGSSGDTAGFFTMSKENGAVAVRRGFVFSGNSSAAYGDFISTNATSTAANPGALIDYWQPNSANPLASLHWSLYNTTISNNLAVRGGWAFTTEGPAVIGGSEAVNGPLYTGPTNSPGGFYQFGIFDQPDTNKQWSAYIYSQNGNGVRIENPFLGAFDAIDITRNSETRGAWLRYNQGTNDWRIGMGTNTYDLGFYLYQGTNSTATNAGDLYFSLRKDVPSVVSAVPLIASNAIINLLYSTNATFTTLNAATGYITNLHASATYALDYVFPSQSGPPSASVVGGTVGVSTNHEIRNINGSLWDYWSDGASVWAALLAAGTNGPFGTNGVTSFNTRFGDVTLISNDVTTALGYSITALTNNYDTIVDVNAKTNLLMTIVGAELLTNNFDTIVDVNAKTNLLDTIVDVNAKTNLLDTIVDVNSKVTGAATNSVVSPGLNFPVTMLFSATGMVFSANIDNPVFSTASALTNYSQYAWITNGFFESIQATNEHIAYLTADNANISGIGGPFMAQNNGSATNATLSSVTLVAPIYIANSNGVISLTLLSNAVPISGFDPTNGGWWSVEQPWLTNLSLLPITTLNVDVLNVTNVQGTITNLFILSSGGNGTNENFWGITTNKYLTYDIGNVDLESNLTVHGSASFVNLSSSSISNAAGIYSSAFMNTPAIYFNTNAYPTVAGTALAMNWNNQFCITNNTVNITGFTAVSNNLVSWCRLGVSNSAAGATTIQWPASVRIIGGTNTSSSVSLPSGKVWYGTFTVDPIGTNLTAAAQVN